MPHKVTIRSSAGQGSPGKLVPFQPFVLIPASLRANCKKWITFRFLYVIHSHRLIVLDYGGKLPSQRWLGECAIEEEEEMVHFFHPVKIACSLVACSFRKLGVSSEIGVVFFIFQAIKQLLCRSCSVPTEHTTIKPRPGAVANHNYIRWVVPSPECCVLLLTDPWTVRGESA